MGQAGTGDDGPLELLPELHPSCEAYSSPAKLRFPLQGCAIPEHQHHSHASQDGHAGDKKFLTRGQTSQVTPLVTRDRCALCRP